MSTHGAQTLRLGGSAAAVGLAGLLIVGLVALLLGGMVLLAAVLGAMSGAAPLLGGLVATGVGVFFLRTVLRDTLRFTTLQIAGDGAWTFRNALGWKVGHVAASDPRAVDWMQRKVTRFVGSVRVDLESWLVIETPDGQRFESVHASPPRQRDARNALDAFIATRRNPH